MNSIGVPVLSVVITLIWPVASKTDIVGIDNHTVVLEVPVEGRKAIIFVVSVFEQFTFVTGIGSVCIEAMLHALDICGDIGPAVISSCRLHDATFNITGLCVINLFDAF